MYCHSPHPSHVLTLHNDLQQNDCGDFTFTLPQPLHVPRTCYEVGLMDFKLFSSSPSTSETPLNIQPAEQATTVQASLFTNAASPVITSLPYIYHPKENVMQLYKSISDDLKALNYPLEFRVEFVKPGMAIFNLIVETDENEYVLLPQQVADTFGFRRRLFSKGRYNSEYIVPWTQVNGWRDLKTYDMKTATFAASDNLITMKRKCPSMVYTWYEYGDTIKQFLDRLCEGAQRIGTNITLDLTDDKITMKYEASNKNETIKLPDTIADLLHIGTKTTFTPGTYAAEDPYDTTIFSELRNGEAFVIEVFKTLEVQIPMDEPSDYSYPEVLNTINSAFTEYNFDNLHPQFVVQDGQIMMICEDYVQVKLPSGVCRYFGIPEEHYFNVAAPMPVNEAIQMAELILIELQQPHMAESKVPVDRNARELLVLIDIIENQAYGNRMVPVLDQISWDYKSAIKAARDPVVYMPLNCDVLSNVRVTLTNEILQILPFLRSHQAVLKLHFRPRCSCC